MFLRSIQFLFYILCPAIASASIHISEFVAINQSGLLDEDGDTEDWIEISNASEANRDLSGWHLTDDPVNLQKWPLPSVIMAPGEFYIIFASGKDRREPNGPWHANFKLAGAGEFLALSDSGGEIVEIFDPSYPTQLPDLSYGADDTGTFRYWQSPTPGQRNVTSLTDGPLLLPENLTSDVTMAEKNVDLAVSIRALPGSNALDAVRCRYRVMYGNESVITLSDDGVAPDETANDQLYSGSLSSRTLFGQRWDPGEMIRWKFEGEDVAGNISHWPSASADEDQPEYLGTIVADPEESSTLPVLHWFAEDPGRAITVSGSWSSAYFAGRFYDHFRVNRRGQSGAIGWPKPKLKFDFNAGHHFRFNPERRLVEEFNLQSHFADASAMRENIAFQFFNDAGTPASHTQHWQVRLNGDYYGLFSYIEQVDTDFLRQQGLDPDGAMYKANGFPATLARGASRALYQKETRKDEPYDDLIDFTNGINGVGELSRSSYVMDQVNLPAMINEISCQVIIKNADRLTKNYYMYRDPKTDLWQRIPWDMDGAFSTSTSLDTENYASPLYGDSEHTQAPNQAIYQNFLLDAIFDSNTTREMYMRRLRTLIDTYLLEDSNYFEPQFDAMLSRINVEAARDASKWGRGNAPSEVQSITTRLLPRRREQLLELYGPSGQGLVPERQTAGLAVEIGEIDVRPEDGPKAEFIELLNMNKEAIDISHWHLEGAVDFVFPSGTVIPKRGTLFERNRHKLYVVKDIRAFRARSTSPRGGQGLFMVGNYDGQLSTRGETIRVLNTEGALVASMTYESIAPEDPLADALGSRPLALQTIDTQVHLVYWRNRESSYQIYIELSTDLEHWNTHTPTSENTLAVEAPLEKVAVPLGTLIDEAFLRLRLVK